MSIPHAAPDTPARTRGAVGTLFAALGAALQWRILLWWLLALALPTAVVALPLFRGLLAQFGDSPAAAAIARGGQLPLLIDGLMDMGDIAPMLSTAALLSALLALLLSPWLTGMVVASIRAGRRLGMGELLRGGAGEYWPMVRMLVWSLIVFAIASFLASLVGDPLGKRADAAILASDAERMAGIANAVGVVLFAFAHMTVEAARGWLAADPVRRSVLRAWGHGVTLVVRRPFASIVLYAGIALIVYGLALLFGWLRLRLAVTGGDGATPLGFLLGLLLSQAVVAMIAWARVARLYGFASLARDATQRDDARAMSRRASAATHSPAITHDAPPIPSTHP